MFIAAADYQFQKIEPETTSASAPMKSKVSTKKIEVESSSEEETDEPVSKPTSKKTPTTSSIPSTDRKMLCKCLT